MITYLEGIKMNELEKFIKLNSIIILEVNGSEVTLKQYEESLVLKMNDQPLLPSIEEVLEPLVGKRACIINSDILGIENQKIKLKSLEKHVLHRLLGLTLTSTIPYLAHIANEEGSSILLQSHYDPDSPALSITAGLVDDIQVLLLDIHYERHERQIPC